MKITTIGDCVVDLYPQEKQTFLGGTAYNRALKAQSAGTQTTLISAIATDSWGKQYLTSLKSHHINTNHLSIIKGQTSHISITLDKHKSPQYSKWQLGVLKKFKLTPTHKKFLSTQAAIIITCFKPIKHLLESFIQLSLSKTLKLADFSGGSIYSPTIKIIDRFLPHLDIAVRNVDYHNQTELNYLKTLAKKHHKIILVLLGQHGSQIFTQKKDYYQPAIKTKATDTTGAGDAYIPIFTIEYLKHQNIQKAMIKATQAASQIITQLGAN